MVHVVTCLSVIRSWQIPRRVSGEMRCEDFRVSDMPSIGSRTNILGVHVILLHVPLCGTRHIPQICTRRSILVSDIVCKVACKRKVVDPRVGFTLGPHGGKVRLKLGKVITHLIRPICLANMKSVGWIHTLKLQSSVEILRFSRDRQRRSSCARRSVYWGRRSKMIIWVLDRQSTCTAQVAVGFDVIFGPQVPTLEI